MGTHNICFYAIAASAGQGHKPLGLSVHVYVRAYVHPTRLRFLSKVESQELLMVAS